MNGPLHGYKILELAGIGPGPFAGMMLADMGAEVIRIDRPGGNPMAKFGHEVLFRSRQSVAIDLKNPRGVETVLRLCESADAIFEGFRPGVAEKLGLGPDDCMTRNPKLVYGRMTGWGQDGPLAKAAGHDLNYVALSGALHAIGRAGEKPVPPLNLVGDFGGGGMFLAYGIVCALLEAQKSGKGQVVDAAMIDGASTLMAMFHAMRAHGLHGERGQNLLDSGAPFYDVYETSDGKYISIGSIEPQFYALLRQVAGLDEALFNAQLDQSKWPEQKAHIEAVLKTRTRDEWCELMEGTDICFAPVLDIDEVPEHPHSQARNSFTTVNGMTQPMPAPRLSRSGAKEPTAEQTPGTHTIDVLSDAGISEADIQNLLACGAIKSL